MSEAVNLDAFSKLGGILSGLRESMQEFSENMLSISNLQHNFGAFVNAIEIQSESMNYPVVSAAVFTSQKRLTSRARNLLPDLIMTSGGF